MFNISCVLDEPAHEGESAHRTLVAAQRVTLPRFVELLDRTDGAKFRRLDLALIVSHIFHNIFIYLGFVHV